MPTLPKPKPKRKRVQETHVPPRRSATMGIKPDTGLFQSQPLPFQRLIDEYLIDLNVTGAAERSGISHTEAYRLLQRREIQEAIKERRGYLDGDRALGGAKYVLGKLWDVATADPREIVQILRVACRHCHGLNGRYQFSKIEMEKLIQAHEYGLNGYPIETLHPRDGYVNAYYHMGQRGLGFDPQGGDDYVPNRDPNPNCRECAGQGNAVSYIADTRKLKNGTRSLYRGVVWSNGRIEVKLANQDHAIELLSRHYGVAVERRDVTVRRVINPSELSDEELAATLVEIEQMVEVVEGNYQVVSNDPAPQARSLTKLARPR